MSSRFVHPKAFVDPASNLCEETRVGADCQIGPEVHTGVCVTIGPGSRLYKQIRIGNSVKIGPNVTLVGPLNILDNVLIEANASVGVVISRTSRLTEGKVCVGAVIGKYASVQGLLSIGEYGRVEPSARLEGHLPHHARATDDPAVLETFVCECGREYDLHMLPNGLWLCSCPKHPYDHAQFRLTRDLLDLRGKLLTA